MNTYGYDANGNLTTINGSPAYTWDRANRLLSYGGSSYSYNELGQRVSQTIGASVTEYLQDVQPALYKVLSATTGANTTRYIHDGIGIHSQENIDGSWNWILKDGLGCIRGLVDSNANSVGTLQYAPYGEIWDSAGTQPLFKFTGEPTDANGLVHLRARYFNPNLGVFPNLDPLELESRYAYVNGNPANFSDPTGLICLGNMPNRVKLNIRGCGGWGSLNFKERNPSMEPRIRTSNFGLINENDPWSGNNFDNYNEGSGEWSWESRYGLIDIDDQITFFDEQSGKPITLTRCADSRSCTTSLAGTIESLLGDPDNETATLSLISNLLNCVFNLAIEFTLLDEYTKSTAIVQSVTDMLLVFANACN